MRLVLTNDEVNAAVKKFLPEGGEPTPLKAVVCEPFVESDIFNCPK
jgi:hypothetical protein